MREPLVDWGANENPDPGRVVWFARLDDRFEIEVWREGESKGTLVIFDHKLDDQEIYSEEVILSYGARFGPDIDDVEAWQTKAIDVVDKYGAP